MSGEKCRDDIDVMLEVELRNDLEHFHLRREIQAIPGLVLARGRTAGEHLVEAFESEFYELVE